jgi:hypothetical protein
MILLILIKSKFYNYFNFKYFNLFNFNQNEIIDFYFQFTYFILISQSSSIIKLDIIKFLINSFSIRKELDFEYL